MDDIAPVAMAPAPTPPVLFMGDSHVQYFKTAQRHFLFAPYRWEGCEVGGATAVGFRNPNSKTDALSHFRKFLEGKSLESVIVIHLGEVDCGFVIWFRAAKYGEDVQIQLDYSLDAYFDFIDELLALGYRRIIITGATLPTITDQDQSGEVVLKRKSVTATQRERTDLTLAYNARLAAGARSRGLLYADISESVLDPATRLVSADFRNKNPEDHHMFYELAAVKWARKLNPLIEALLPRRVPAREKIWRAKEDSFIRAYNAAALTMPEPLRLMVKKNTVLRARLDAERAGLLVIHNPALNGRALDGRLRLLRAAHWEELHPAAPETAGRS